MHKIHTLVLLAVAWTLFPSVGTCQDPIRWEATLENAQRLAAQSNRLVLIHFWAPWCGVCKQMEAEVYSQRAVAAAVNANYVPVKINTMNFPAIAQQYGVSALPTTVILTSRGQVVYTMRGKVDASPYAVALDQVAADVKRRSSGVYAQIPGNSAPTVPAGVSQIAPPQTASAPQPNASPTATQPAAMAPNPSMLTNNLSNDRYAAYYNRGQAAPTGQAAPPANPAQPQNGPVNGTPNPAAPPLAAASAQANQPGQTPASAAVQPNAMYASQTVSPPGAAAASQQPPLVASRAPMQNPAPNAASPTSNNPPLCLDGYCPVTLTEKQQWVLGDRRYGAIHRGRTYLFAGPEEKQRFFANPDGYAPAISGDDLVMAVEQNQHMPGMREHGVYFGNHIYLFSSEASLQKFSQNPNAYANYASEALRAGNPAR